MSNDVTLTAALRSNLLSLQNTQRLLDQTQLRLATGKKVNSALDNANAFFASQSLNFRAGDLGNLLDGIGQGIQAMKAADTAITSMTKLLNQAQAIAQEAREQSSGGAQLSTMDISAADAADLTAGPGTIATAGQNFTIAIGTGTPVAITITANMSLQDVVNEINDTVQGVTAAIEPGSAPGTARIRLNSDGQNIIIAEGGGTAAADVLGAAAIGTEIASNVPPLDQVRLQADYNIVLDKINDLIKDANYRGVNLLDSSNLTIRFNEDGSSKLTVAGVDFSVGGQTGGGLGINQANFATVGDIDVALLEIKTALDTVRAQARSYGTALTILQTREDFTKNIVNTLKEGSDKLTLADTNEEGAKLLSLQTAQQLGITSMSLASQAQQGVLRLFS